MKKIKYASERERLADACFFRGEKNARQCADPEPEEDSDPDLDSDPCGRRLPYKHDHWHRPSWTGRLLTGLDEGDDGRGHVLGRDPLRLFARGGRRRAP